MKIFARIPPFERAWKTLSNCVGTGEIVFLKKIWNGYLTQTQIIKGMWTSSQCRVRISNGFHYEFLFYSKFCFQNFLFDGLFKYTPLPFSALCLFFAYILLFLHIFQKFQIFSKKTLEFFLHFCLFCISITQKKARGCNIIWGFNIKWLIPILTCILIEFYHILIFINVFPFSLFFFDFRSEFFNCIYFKK